MQKLVTEARAKHVAVIYSLSVGAVTADIAKEVAYQERKDVVTSGPDKFLGTDLESILKNKKYKDLVEF